MSTPLKFEFDFDEVFEGIKQGVIRELAETNFDAAKDTAINQVKSEVKAKGSRIALSVALRSLFSLIISAYLRLFLLPFL